MSSAVLRSALPRVGLRASERDARGESAPLVLVSFVALAAFATGHWFGLVRDAPGSRAVVLLVIVAALGAVLTAVGSVAKRRVTRNLLAIAFSLVGGALAFRATGLSFGLLDPRHWGDLADLLDRGLGGLAAVEFPYGGRDPSVSLVILLGAPAVLVPATALAFWPSRGSGAVRRTLALALLLVLYATSLIEFDPGAPIGRGLALLALVGAWLWLPRIRARAAIPAAVTLAVVALLAIPFAVKLDTGRALVDYRNWDFFGKTGVVFDWNHTYGPLDWPRDGTVLLNVKSKRPLYWKAETLDTFDGRRWLRSSLSDDTLPYDELPAIRDRRWNERFTVTVRSLTTDFVIGAGTPFKVAGAGQALSQSGDGTLRRLDQPLQRGDRYTVDAYVPDPSPVQLRGSMGSDRGPNSPEYRRRLLRAYTYLLLPEDGPAPLSAEAKPKPGNGVLVPRWGSGADRTKAARKLANSDYARTYALAQRLTVGQPTAYDAVKSVQRYLNRGFVYSENPPRSRLPLQNFLFKDKIGYCQQFSGAMALMLRMAGIPSRVVSGFSPGSLDKNTGEYRVRDLDAHSWVEVYFPQIGWVTFDPTPSGSPAVRAGGEGQGGGGASAGAANLGSGDPSGSPGSGSTTQGRHSDGAAAAASTAADSGNGGGGPWTFVLAALVIGALVSAAAVAVRRLRTGRLGVERAREVGLRELERALPRLGWRVSPRDTLLSLERRLARAAGPEAARYVADLRGGRYGMTAAAPPSPAQRRRLRRELAATGGLRARALSFVAFPPGGPRIRT